MFAVSYNHRFKKKLEKEEEEEEESAKFTSLLQSVRNVTHGKMRV